jgi:CRP/FNR family transcriptional regulator, anaerobic regulatory protein
MLMKLHSPIYLQDTSHPQAQVCASCEVRRSALFGALDEASLDQIHAHIAAPHVDRDEALYTAGSQGDAVFTIRSGLVRFERVTESGERRILRLAGRGDLIGQEALLQRPYQDDAIACTPVEVCRIPRSLVDHLGETASPLMRELMNRWQMALDESAAWTADLTTGVARRRVLKLVALLSRHANAQGETWLPRRDEMGDMLGMTLETASRQISLLKREGLLTLLPPHGVRVNQTRLQEALKHLDA